MALGFGAKPSSSNAAIISLISVDVKDIIFDRDEQCHWETTAGRLVESELDPEDVRVFGARDGPEDEQCSRGEASA